MPPKGRPQFAKPQQAPGSEMVTEDIPKQRKIQGPMNVKDINYCFTFHTMEEHVQFFYWLRTEEAKETAGSAEPNIFDRCQDVVGMYLPSLVPEKISVQGH